jgi:MSHA biogenesis protein MshP
MCIVSVSRRQERGFALVAAIFIVVVLAILGIMMVTIGGMERATASAAVQGARAYHAARAGIEWGAFMATGALPSSCVASTTFTLPAPGLSGFSVTVQCTSTPHREGGTTYDIFVISSTATSGAFGDADHVSRTLQTTVTNAPVS